MASRLARRLGVAIALLLSTASAWAQTVPPNDQCGDAIAIGLGETAFSTVGATTTGPPLPSECDKGFGLSFVNDIWFVHAARFGGTLEVSTCNAASFDTRLAGYLLGPCDSLLLVACNDDGAGCSLFTSIMQMPVEAGKSYLIRLGAFMGSGAGVLTLTDKLSDVCVPADHGCFEVGLPGCDDFECCSVVCAIDLFCCVGAWDFLCVAQATALCNACGEPEAGDCCAANGTPSCANAACCEAVCAKDPFCCQVQWDVLCAAEAELVATCGCDGQPPAVCDSARQGCYETGPAGCADAACCAAICSFDPFCCEVAWDALCVEAAVGLCPGCGNPLAGSCCLPHAGTHCADEACCAAICAADPFCCTVAWDGLCAEQAIAAVGCACDVDGACPGSGACDVPGDDPGCEDVVCCATVCAKDPFCCLVSWDAICANVAREICEEPAPCVGDLNGDGIVNGADLGVLLNSWNAPGGPADLNGDGVVNGADLGILLNAWGPCPG